jgi:segregation and condensation protein B
MALGHGPRGIALEEVAGGYQLRTPREHALYVRKLLAAKPPRLSRPLLETLAIVAYRQPITRPEIEQLRGVDSGGVLDTLLERRLIKIAGRKEAPGRPIVYATSTEFLEVFGLRDLDGLPDLEEFKELEGRKAGEGDVTTPGEPANSSNEAAGARDEHGASAAGPAHESAVQEAPDEGSLPAQPPTQPPPHDDEAN